MWLYRTELVQIKDQSLEEDIQTFTALLVAAGKDRWNLDFVIPVGKDHFLLIFICPICPRAVG